MECKSDIYGGTNQLLPNATHAEQHIHYHNGDGEHGAAPVATPLHPHTLVILGAGVDAAVGLPTSAQIIPSIVDWLQTEEGKAIDEALRKQLRRLSFHFDKFVDRSEDTRLNSSHRL